jgi:hypothetical protein
MKNAFISIVTALSITACAGTPVPRPETPEGAQEQKTPDHCADQDLLASYRSFRRLCDDPTTRPQRRFEYCRAATDMNARCHYETEHDLYRD